MRGTAKTAKTAYLHISMYLYVNMYTIIYLYVYINIERERLTDMWGTAKAGQDTIKFRKPLYNTVERSDVPAYMGESWRKRA